MRFFLKNVGAVYKRRQASEGEGVQLILLSIETFYGRCMTQNEGR